MGKASENVTTAATNNKGGDGTDQADGRETSDEEKVKLNEKGTLHCVDQVQYLPGLHERYWGRLDEARREAVRLRTERRVREALANGPRR